MDNETKLKVEESIVEMLKTVYDPEIPVNVYDLGLIYKIDLQDDGEVVIDMTLTAPNCPAADFIMEDIRQKIESVEGVTISSAPTFTPASFKASSTVLVRVLYDFVSPSAVTLKSVA